MNIQKLTRPFGQLLLMAGPCTVRPFIINVTGPDRPSNGSWKKLTALEPPWGPKVRPDPPMLTVMGLLPITMTETTSFAP